MSLGAANVLVPAAFALAGGAWVLARQWRREQLARVLGRGAAVQLAADGRMALTAILQRDPDFSEEQLVERCAEFQERFYAAWTARDIAPVGGVLRPGLRDRVVLDLDLHATQLRKQEVYDLSVSQARVVEAVHDGVFDTVYVRLTGEAMRRTMHGGTNRWLSGGANPEAFEEIWGLTRRSGVASRNDPGTLEGFCPTCGADLLESTSETACSACGTCLNDGSHDWAVALIARSTGWRPSDVPPPEAGQPEEALSTLLDSVTGLFWRVRSAAVHADPEPLRGRATPAYLEAHAAEFRATRDGRRNFHGQVELGRIEWLGYSEGRPWLRVQWRGQPVQARVPSFIQDDDTRAALMVDDFVLTRPADGGTGWLLADVHRVLGEVPCPEQLESLGETRQLERLPVMTDWEREILLQTCVALLLRRGPVVGRRYGRLVAAAPWFGVEASRVPELLHRVEAEGATLFGRDCRLPPETLFRHLARTAVSCGARRSAVEKLLRDVAIALGVASSLRPVLLNEQRLLADAVRRISRAGRPR